MNNPQVKIVLVDDHRLILQSWKLLLEQDPRFTIVAECEDGPNAILTTRELIPDVILMDINMTPLNGFETTRSILTEFPDMKIIGISVNNQPSYANKMLQLGGKGFVTKSSSFDELTNAIENVMNGGTYICEEIRKQMN
jgi:two-component system invasion response regulator UvrY